MAKQSNKKIDVTGRELVLAGIGAVSLTRKQAIRAYGALVAEGSQVRERIENGIDSVRGQIETRVKTARNDVRGRIAPVIKQINARVEPIIDAVNNRVEKVSNQVQTRLSPLLAKAGIETARPAAKKRKPAAKRTTRKPAARKRATKKAA